MTKNEIDRVTEKTLVPISLVITIIGGVVWLSTLWARSETNARDIQKAEVSLESLTKEMKQSHDEVRQELMRIRIELANFKRR